MIDVNTESLVLFSAPRDYWPVQPTPHISQLHRWRLKGLLSRAGVRVQIETLMIGGRRYTSKEAVSRYIAALNDGDVASFVPVTDPDRASQEAAHALEALGA